jgi:hypothetical protein
MPAGARLKGAMGGTRPLDGFVLKIGAGLCGGGTRAGVVEGLSEGAMILPPPLAPDMADWGTINRATVRTITASG